MKKAEIVVTIVTLYAIFFNAAPYIGVTDGVILSMFILSPLAIIFMVYVVLKYGEPSGHTFDESFYDDWDYKRNGKEELDIQG